MATTAAGTPYVEASDLVAGYPAVSLALANHIDTIGGKILQVVSGQTNTTVTSSSATYADTGLTATITPSSTSNKILVLLAQYVTKSAGTAITRADLRLLRDGTSLNEFAKSIGFTNSSSNLFGLCVTLMYLDTPAAITALVYKTQFANPAASATISVQDGNSLSTMILMEVAA